MSEPIELPEYGAENQRSGSTGAREDSGATSTGFSRTAEPTNLTSRQAAALAPRNDPAPDDPPAPGQDPPPAYEAAPTTPAAAAPEPWWKKYAFWNRLLPILFSSLFSSINLWPTFTARTVDDRRFQFDLVKAEGDRWTRYIAFRQECEKNRDASRPLTSECIGILAQPLLAPPDYALLPRRTVTQVVTITQTPEVHKDRSAPAKRYESTEDTTHADHDMHVEDEFKAPEAQANSAEPPNLTVEQKRALLWMKKHIDFSNYCTAEKDAKHHLSPACTEVLAASEARNSLNLSEDTVKAINAHFEEELRSKLSPSFRRATEGHPKLKACIVVLVLGLAPYLFVAGYDALEHAATLKDALLWRFLDASDARSWSTWGTLLGLAYFFYQGTVDLPGQDELWTPLLGKQGKLILALMVLCRLSLSNYLIPWFVSWAFVYLGHGLFARRWNLEAAWQLDGVYLDFRDPVWTGLQRGIFWATCFENLLYLTGYWGTMSMESVDAILREQRSFGGVDLKWW